MKEIGGIENKKGVIDKTKEFADKYKIGTITSVVSAVLLAIPQMNSMSSKTFEQNQKDIYKNHLSVKINRKKTLLDKKINDSIKIQSNTDNSLPNSNN